MNVVFKQIIRIFGKYAKQELIFEPDFFANDTQSLYRRIMINKWMKSATINRKLDGHDNKV